MDKKLLRIIDANLNRLREGLRVLEDIARFVLENPSFTKSLKALRHNVTDIMLGSKKIPEKLLLESRDTKKDHTKFLYLEKSQKIDLSNIFMANLQRTKESLRVLEECTKTFDEKLSCQYIRLRFTTYELEKKFIKKLGDIPSNGCSSSKK